MNVLEQHRFCSTCGLDHYEGEHTNCAPREIVYLGFCKNCYQDIIEGDHMDCCGNLELIETTPHTPTKKDYSK